MGDLSQSVECTDFHDILTGGPVLYDTIPSTQLFSPLKNVLASVFL